MMYIDKSKIQILNNKWPIKAAAFLKEMEDANNQLERNVIIEKYSGYWKVFKNQLKKISYNKCWYSESKNPYSHYHIDHFRPKKKVVEFDNVTERDGYWWLSFDVTNFRLAGSVGNTKKGNHFAVSYNKVTAPGPLDDEGYYFLDPCSSEDVKLLNFSQDGRAVESAPVDQEKWHYDRANYTIDKLDLNYPDLVETRRLKWQEVYVLVVKVNNKIKIYNETPSATTKAKVESAKDEIRKLLAPCSELTATVRCCLRSTGKDWAYKLLEETIDINLCNNNDLT